MLDEVKYQIFRRKRAFQVWWRQRQCKAPEHARYESPSGEIGLEICEACGCWAVEVRGELRSASIWEDLIPSIDILRRECEENGEIAAASEFARIRVELDQRHQNNNGGMS